MRANLDRDFAGYGRYPPHAEWPGGARVAVNFVINVEEGAEYSIGDGDSHSESALIEVTAPRVPIGDRDLGAESMYEYGARAGFWRLARLFDDRRLPLTAFVSALALERNQEAAAYIRESGWDICCHGYRWVEHYKLARDVERDYIHRAYASLERTTGRRPTGWYSRYAPSVNTRELVAEHGGFTYDSDSYADDLPYWLTVKDRPHLVLPYSLVTNDAKLAGSATNGDEFFALLRDAFDVLYAEGGDRPKMMSVGMHSRLLGHPARSAGLARFLDHVQGRENVWICRRAEIAQHWTRRFGAKLIDAA